MGESYSSFSDLCFEVGFGLFAHWRVFDVLFEQIIDELLEVGFGFEKGVLGFGQLVYSQVGLASAAMKFSQKEVIGVFHDFDDRDGCFELLDGELEVAHGSKFSGFVEVDIGQEVEAFVGVGFVRLLVLA